MAIDLGGASLIGGTSVQLTLDPIALNFLLRSPSGPTGRFILSLANQTVAAAKLSAPVRTARTADEASRSGRLRSSIALIDFTPTTEGMQAQVAVNVEYALPVHYGLAGGRPIKPKTGKVLRFPGKGGGVVYRSQTTQGRTTPNPFFWTALLRVLITDPRVKILSQRFDPGTPL